MAMPGLEGLLEYAKTLPELLRQQFLAGIGAFAENKMPISTGGSQVLGALNPFAQVAQDAAVQAGGLIAPQVNALSQTISQGSENLGLGPLSIPEVTDEQLAPFLMLGMGGRNKMGFYSPSGKALTTAPGKGQPGQYLAHLKKEPGATKEAKETGLLQALEQAPGTLTKEEVVSMWNPIELDETVRSGSSEPQMGAGGTYHHPDRTTATKYAHEESLNLPGGSNPKEILVQLPVQEDSAPLFTEWMKSKGYDPAYRTNYVREYQREYPPKDVTEYTGGHWDEPNVLAHIRTNERDVGGKKALHIEEIQSDWHQTGQKHGYQNTEPTLLQAKKYFGIPDDIWARLPPVRQQWYVDEIIETVGWGDVPDAPFKKNWHELAFKRALMEGINDPSIERLTWTTGAVQADRYDLSKYIDEIEVKPSGDNWHLVVKYKEGSSGALGFGGGAGVENLPNIPRDESSPSEYGKLADYVGKEMADKIVNDADGTTKTYSGLDLEVGGEYHKQLYDGKITKFAQKFLKKYGVEPERFKPGGWEVFDPKTGEATNYFSTEEEAGRFVDDWNGRPGDLGFERIPGSIRDYEEAKGDYWYIDITPEMRQDLQQKGVPLTMNNKKPFLAYA